MLPDEDVIDPDHDHPTEPAAESTGPAAESTGPAAESTGPAAESTGPAAESTGPAAESTGPAAESTGLGAELTAELTALRRGQGLLAHDVMMRVGPRLTASCGITPDMSPGERRLRLVEKIGATVLELQSELQLAVQAALALHPDAQDRFLNDRMRWLGEQIDRDPRTATRRVNVGLKLLAERLAEPAGATENGNIFAPDGWYVESQHSTILLDVDPVRVLEIRRVVCTKDGLDRLTVAWSIPAELPEIKTGRQVEMIRGGRLHKDHDTSTDTYWSGSVELPRPLKAGDIHEFEVHVTALPRGLMRPYFVLSPYRRCDEFVLTARFDPDHPPAEVWELDGVPFEFVNEAQARGRILTVDNVGEVSSRFLYVRAGLSYGLRWRDQPEN